MRLRYPNYDLDQIELVYQTELAHFQDVNMRMWDIVRGSLDLTSAFEKTDRAMTRATFMNGDLRDAHNLFMWADKFGDMSGIKSQVKVNTDLNSYRMLSVKAGLDEIVSHATDLL